MSMDMEHVWRCRTPAVIRTTTRLYTPIFTRLYTNFSLACTPMKIMTMIMGIIIIIIMTMIMISKTAPP